MTTMTIAAMAVRAARNRRTWGRDATMRYLRRRGVPVRLYQIAMACEAEARGEFWTEWPDVDVLVLSGNMRQWSGRWDGRKAA